MKLLALLLVLGTACGNAVSPVTRGPEARALTTMEAL